MKAVGQHPNAHVLRRFAEVARTTDNPWGHFECRTPGGEWQACTEKTPMLTKELELRERIHNPITINGETFEGPMTEAPAKETEYWILFDDRPNASVFWFDAAEDFQLLWEGAAFRTREARDAVQAAITKLLKWQGMSGQPYGDVTRLPEHDEMPESEQMFRWVEQRARQTFMHWRAQARGQQIVRADNYESHLVWATLEWAKNQKEVE